MRTSIMFTRTVPMLASQLPGVGIPLMTVQRPFEAGLLFAVVEVLAGLVATPFGDEVEPVVCCLSDCVNCFD